MKYKFVYFVLSLVAISVGIVSLFLWRVKLGIDFTGGSSIEYQIKEGVNREEIKKSLEKEGIVISSEQTSGKDRVIIKTSNLNSDQEKKVREIIKHDITFENVGPSIGPDLIKKTLIAMGISAMSILIWVAIQFKSFKFGVSAVLAMFHDSLVLFGAFSLFGHFFGAELDFLFVTAMLTILSFSVHDTIVVYDRIRELHRKEGGELSDIADQAVRQTLVRSFNNSMTIIIMLLSLIMFGGSTVKWFAVALLVGTISGTYSSPFVAVPLLLVFDKLAEKLRRNK